tara:strand:- start:320 stop:1045 length:726 start_codon:yes stop_codon:yes gene_type:complete
MTDQQTVKIKEPLFPKYTMYWDEKDETHRLEFDGESLPTPYRLVLSEIGSIEIKTALCNLPIYKTYGAFWGYKGQPIDLGLWNCEPPEDGCVIVQLSSKEEEALIAVGNHLSDPKCWRDGRPLKGGDTFYIPTLEKWGDWHIDKSNLCLNLLPKDHSTKWNHDCPFYQIDLESVNSNSEILDWIFQLNHKNLNIYGKNVVKDLVRALDDIFDPQNNCCSSGKNKAFSGTDLAKKYAESLKK